MVKKADLLKQMGFQHVCGDCTIMQSRGKLKNFKCMLCGASYSPSGLLDMEITKKKIYDQFSKFGFTITPLEVEMVVTKAITSQLSFWVFVAMVIQKKYEAKHGKPHP